ncbi:MAG: hypothetical protein ABIU77_09250 [Ferruginibacter sp.]
MEQIKIIETLETSLVVNIWVQRNSLIIYLITGIIAIYAQFNLMMFFELLLGIFLFIGIVFMGFVGIAAHMQYYFQFERNRKVELYSDRIVVICKNGQVVDQIFKRDIDKIVLYDKIKSYGYNLWPTNADSYYYITVIGKNQEKIILTCLLDISLKKKVASWYGQELQHKYQFFPLPNSQNNSPQRAQDRGGQ